MGLHDVEKHHKKEHQMHICQGKVISFKITLYINRQRKRCTGRYIILNYSHNKRKVVQIHHTDLAFTERVLVAVFHVSLLIISLIIVCRHSLVLSVFTMDGLNAF